LNSHINTASSSDPSLIELYDSVSKGQEALLATLLRLLGGQHIAIQEREQVKTVHDANTNIRMLNRDYSVNQEQAEVTEDTKQATFILNGSSALLLFKSGLKSNTYLSLDFATQSDCQHQLLSSKIQQLLPHIQQSLSISEKITQQETELEAVNYVLDHYPIPSLAIDRQFNVVFSNHAANTQLSMIAPASTSHALNNLAKENINLLSLCTQATQRQTLRHILTQSQSVGQPINRYLYLDMAGHKLPLVISSSSRIPTTVRHYAHEQLIWVYFLNQNYSQTLKRHLNFKALKLSIAETELASSLFAGRSLNDISETRKVSKQTVRKQLQSILRKAECENQEKLMLLFFEQCIHYSLIHSSH